MLRQLAALHGMRLGKQVIQLGIGRIGQQLILEEGLQLVVVAQGKQCIGIAVGECQEVGKRCRASRKIVAAAGRSPIAP